MGSLGPVEKPTVLFIHGAWHRANCWDSVIFELKQHQYPIQTIELLSSGGEPTTTVADDAAHIRKTTEKLVAAGKEVVLVMHSYGGIPGTESAKGLLKKDRQAEQKAGGIVSLVYITAFLLPPGATLASFLGDMPPWLLFEDNKMTVTIPDQIFYNDLSDEHKKEYSEKLQYQAKPSFYTPLTYPAYQDSPVAYLLCEQDNAIPFFAQQAMAGIGGPNVVSHVCSASHSPMLSMPSKVVEVIRGAVGEVVA
ncbi:Alpha/beta hydrolase fold-1 [Xylogone sp. PMI_703]|nr:Alpha/beta hydrolase fold-1 [Xylogone sp. PMI_703]